MSFTAEQYKTAATVLREEFQSMPGVSEHLDVMAERAAKRTEYLEDLYKFASYLDPSDWLRAGIALTLRLKSDGWTPPEGLF